MAMKVYVVEDSPIVRERLVTMLGDIPGAEVAGASDNTPDALLDILRIRPDVAILDIHLRDGNGITVLKEIRRALPGTTAIMFTNHSGPAVRQRCMRAGADHFFDKTDEFDQLRILLEGIARQPRPGHSASCAVRRRAFSMYGTIRSATHGHSHGGARGIANHAPGRTGTAGFEPGRGSVVPENAGAATSPDLHGIVVVDPHGVVRFCSAAAARAFGSDADRLAGKPIASLVPQLPLRSGTPGYNLAYALFWFPDQLGRAVEGLDCDGRAVPLEISVSAARIEGKHQLLLSLRRVGLASGEFSEFDTEAAAA
jgi:CheY-like chemotaxis protein